MASIMLSKLSQVVFVTIVLSVRVLTSYGPTFRLVIAFRYSPISKQRLCAMVLFIPSTMNKVWYIELYTSHKLCDLVQLSLYVINGLQLPLKGLLLVIPFGIMAKCDAKT